jgi:ABC-type branched-subunit amino acid transport system substrate-binding protein
VDKLSRATRWVVPTTVALLVAACSSGGSVKAASSSATTTVASSASSAPAGNATAAVQTIKIGALGVKGQLPGVEWGIRARVQRFNETNEIPGIKLEFTEYLDDQLNPAVALTEARRLVTQDKIFVLIDYSPVTPDTYLEQQHVPWFGYAFDNTYCSAAPDPNIWGFGINGCLVPQKPVLAGDTAGRLYQYLVQVTGKQQPTVALFADTSQSGQNAVTYQANSYKGAGFDVVLSTGLVPPPPVTDYTPYVQQLMTSDHGHAPDFIQCYLSAECIPIYTQLRADGFKGEFGHTLYSDQLTKTMAGSTVNNPYGNLSDPSPQRDQIKQDVAAVNPTQPLETGDVTAYLATDMFIQALKKAAASGTSGIAPDNVRQIAAMQTWQFGNFAGPTVYPQSTVTDTPNCSAVLKSNGTAWVTVVPYACSTRQFAIHS